MENSLPETRSPSIASRFLFIDLLRGWAVLVMIETHVVNALLQPSIKDGNFFPFLSFVNGLVAPSFLFCSGLALAITLSRRWDEYASLRKQFWRYLVRLGFILVVAYSLHLPFFSYTRLTRLTDAGSWSSFYLVDILQVIAVTLFFLVVIVPLLGKKKIYYPVVLLVGLLVVFVTPLVREMDPSSYSVWIRPYLSTQVKSQFPLFPWSSFLIGGVIVGSYFIWMRERSDERRVVRHLFLGSIVVGLGSLLIEVLPVQVYPEHSFFKYSPEFFFVRLALVTLALAGLWRYASGRTPVRSSVVSIFGQESLLVYVVHLLIVYGYTYEYSFIRMFGPTLNFLQCAGLFITLTIVMYGMAFTWHALKGWNKAIANTVQFAVLSAIVLEFFLKQS